MMTGTYKQDIINTNANFSSLQNSSQQQKALESSESLRATVAEERASQLQIEVCMYVCWLSKPHPA